MKKEVRQADSKGRVALPGFANATLIIERVNDTEYRVRKAVVIPESDLHFHEEDGPVELPEKDARQFLDLLENPPKPNQALKQLLAHFKESYGEVDD